MTRFLTTTITYKARVILAAALLATLVVAVPSPARAVTTEYWISDQATAAAVGAGTSCEEPDFRYTGAGGGMFNDALSAVIADISTSDTTIYLCNDGENAETYVMDADTTAPNDMNGSATAAARVTVIGVSYENEPTLPELTNIFATGTSPFDFTDAHVTISNLSITAAFDDSDGGAIHVMSDSATDTLVVTINEVEISGSTVTGAGNGAGVNATGNVIVTDSHFSLNVASDRGGAIYADGDVTVSNSFFYGNAAESGGAIYATGSVAISSSELGEVGGTTDDWNIADNNGGVAYVEGPTLTVTNSTFGGNYADNNGGVFYVEETTVRITGSTFTGNYADDESGGVIHAEQDGQVITVTNSTFIGNNAYSGDGGALSADGGDIVVSNSVFTNNDANYGAIAVDDGSVSVNKVTMRQNDAGDEGGAIWSGVDVTVLSSRFIDNYADGHGGAIYLEEGIATISGSVFEGNETADEGGGIYLSDCESSKVSRNTFVENHADSGGAINDSCNDDAVVTLEANTFTRNTAEDWGAALDHDSDSLLIFRSNRFTSNAVSDGEGGALWINYAKFYKNRFESNSATDCGGAVYVSNSDFNTLARGGNVFKRNTGGGSARDRQVCFDNRSNP
jgi:predicted outer membrane repeat protein/parallel beta-helix repeat protein